jgi:hypothetical protein
LASAAVESTFASSLTAVVDDSALLESSMAARLSSDVAPLPRGGVTEGVEVGVRTWDVELATDEAFTFGAPVGEAEVVVCCGSGLGVVI